MVKRHLKSLNAPKTWNVGRKATVYITRPNPGAHSFNLGYSINHLLKNELKLSSKSKETKYILNNSDCLVNGKAVKDIRHIVGFMDVVSFPKINKYYRIILSEKGRIIPVEIDKKETNIKLSKLTNKSLIKGGKLQLHTLDGRNILVDKGDYETSDTLVVELPSQKVTKSLPFKEGSLIMLIGGKHIGVVGEVEKIESNKIFFKKENKTYETLKKYVFVLGKGKSEVKVK